MEVELSITPHQETRRQLLTKLGFGTCALSGVGVLLAMGDFLEPKVLFERESRFGAGPISDFPEGTVKFYQEHRIFLIGGRIGVFALSAECTHLGCITRHTPGETWIACPCHGSKFDLEGRTLSGPARRDLSWIEVQADSTGNLTVDTSVIVTSGEALRP